MEQTRTICSPCPPGPSPMCCFYCSGAPSWRAVLVELASAGPRMGVAKPARGRSSVSSHIREDRRPRLLDGVGRHSGGFPAPSSRRWFSVRDHALPTRRGAGARGRGGPQVMAGRYWSRAAPATISSWNVCDQFSFRSWSAPSYTCPLSESTRQMSAMPLVWMSGAGC